MMIGNISMPSIRVRFKCYSVRSMDFQFSVYSFAAGNVPAKRKFNKLSLIQCSPNEPTNAQSAPAEAKQPIGTAAKPDEMSAATSSGNK